MSQTKDWIYVDQSQDIFRKAEFYNLNWNLENSFFIPASFGGPIAITRDINKPDIRPGISIYSQAGLPIKSFQVSIQNKANFYLCV
jgi:hypothetical protein